MLPSLFYRVFLFQFSSIWFSHYDTGDTVAEFAIRFVSLTDEKLVVAMFHTHTHRHWKMTFRCSRSDKGHRHGADAHLPAPQGRRGASENLLQVTSWNFSPTLCFWPFLCLTISNRFFLVLACWLLDVAWRSASSFLFQKCVPQFVFFLTIVGLQSAV